MKEKEISLEKIHFSFNDNNLLKLGKAQISSKLQDCIQYFKI